MGIGLSLWTKRGGEIGRNHELAKASNTVGRHSKVADPPWPPTNKYLESQHDPALESPLPDLLVSRPTNWRWLHCCYATLSYTLSYTLSTATLPILAVVGLVDRPMPSALATGTAVPLPSSATTTKVAASNRPGPNKFSTLKV